MVSVWPTRIRFGLEPTVLLFSWYSFCQEVPFAAAMELRVSPDLTV